MIASNNVDGCSCSLINLLTVSCYKNIYANCFVCYVITIYDQICFAIPRLLHKSTVNSISYCHITKKLHHECIPHTLAHFFTQDSMDVDRLKNMFDCQVLFCAAGCHTITIVEYSWRQRKSLQNVSAC